MYLLSFGINIKSSFPTGIASAVYRNFSAKEHHPALFRDLAEPSYYNRTAHFPLYFPIQE
ncbi:hypothetical protein CEF21_19875 [Bacillus sp. FJAT-42376]|nr:hypothetical protein CEF21_19875 [Bacillus sp. FJAT-42376]